MIGSYKRSNYDLDLFDQDYNYGSVARDRAADSRRSNRRPERKSVKNQKNNSKQNKVVQFSQKLTKRSKKGGNLGPIIMGSVLALVIVVTVIIIISSQARLTELNQSINDAKDTLSEKQSVYTQLQMKVDANLSTAVIEKYAQEKLGMRKASNSQKEFINLSRGDKAEVVLDEKGNVFSDIAEAFSDIW